MAVSGDVWDVGSSGCGMFGFLGYGMLGICNVWDVRDIGFSG